MHLAQGLMTSVLYEVTVLNMAVVFCAVESPACEQRLTVNPISDLFAWMSACIKRGYPFAVLYMDAQRLDRGPHMNEWFPHTYFEQQHVSTSLSLHACKSPFLSPVFWLPP